MMAALERQQDQMGFELDELRQATQDMRAMRAELARLVKFKAS